MTRKRRNQAAKRLTRWLCGTVLLLGGLTACAQYPCDLAIYPPSTFTNFQPMTIVAGGHPTSYGYTLFNQGSYPAYNGALVDFYLSRDTGINNGDDLWIGQRYDLTSFLSPGASTNLNVSVPAGIGEITIPASALGAYYVFARVSPASASNYDPDSSDNFGFLSDPVTHAFVMINVVTAAPLVSSIVRLNPAVETNNAQTVTWRVTFSQAVVGVDVPDFALTAVAGSLPGRNVLGVSQSGATSFDVTAYTGTGDGVLRLDVPYPGASIWSTSSGLLLTNSFTSGQVYTLDRVPPAALDLVHVAPDPRTTAVTNVDVQFSEPIKLASFNYSSVALWRNGSPVTLDVRVQMAAVTDATYRISGLDAFTALNGSYQLSVICCLIQDLAGNTITNSVSDSWAKWATPDGIVYVDRAFAGPNSNGTLGAPFKAVADGYTAAQSNNVLRIFGGNYNETLVLDKTLVVTGTNGVVNLGIP